MYIKFKIIVYRAKIQKKCAEYKKLAVSFNKIRYAQECIKKKLRIFLCHSIRLQYLCKKQKHNIMEICIVCGARPNFIKVAPLIRAIDKSQKEGHDIHCSLVYTGTETDPTLEASLFSDLELRKPDVCLGVDCENLNELTGRVMSLFEHYLSHRKTDIVVVVDDLASTMAAAIVTKKQGIKLAHIAAGTRSFDISMPKEINRLVIDGLSDILFTAGMSNNSIADREGAELSKVYMVGNTLIDNLRFMHGKWQDPSPLEGLRLQEGGYMLFTLNRKALIADTEGLHAMVNAVAKAATGMPVVAPLRGLARKAVEEAVEEALEPELKGVFHIVEPVGYLEFGWLAAHAAGVITDSGNVAEEATFNGVPCLTLNDYTEHIETVKVGTNELVGEDPEKITAAIDAIRNNKWKKAQIPDRWDGRSAERILQVLVAGN